MQIKYRISPQQMELISLFVTAFIEHITSAVKTGKERLRKSKLHAFPLFLCGVWAALIALPFSIWFIGVISLRGSWSYSLAKGL